MRRLLLTLVTLASITWLALAAASTTSAQESLVAGEVPAPESVGLLTTTQATPVTAVVEELTLRGCDVVTIGITQDGRWLLFSPDTPTFVAVQFPQLTADQPFFVRCGAEIRTQDNVVTGTVTYLQRIALPPTAVLSVSLEDVSLLDAPAVTIAQQRIETGGGQVPFSFELVYDPADIVDNHTYAVRAEITVDGALWFTTDVQYAVITNGSPRTVDITLAQVAGTDPGTDPLTQVVGREWEWIATTMPDGSTVEPNVRGDSTLLLNPDGSVYIDTDCNTYFGTYTLEGTALTITPQGSTRMACLGTSKEEAYVGGLEQVVDYSIVQDGTTLVLGFESGEGNMSFVTPD